MLFLPGDDDTELFVPGISRSLISVVLDDPRIPAWLTPVDLTGYDVKAPGRVAVLVECLCRRPGDWFPAANAFHVIPLCFFEIFNGVLLDQLLQTIKELECVLL
jgi:hypothetical protein